MNKKALASLAASVSLLAAPSARGTKGGIVVGSTLLAAGAVGAYVLCNARGKVELAKMIDNMMLKLVRIVDTGGGSYVIRFGKNELNFVAAYVKDACGNIKKVLVKVGSEIASKENLLYQLNRVQNSGGAIDRNFILEVDDLIKCARGDGYWSDLIRKFLVYGSNFFMRVFMSRFNEHFGGTINTVRDVWALYNDRNDRYVPVLEQYPSLGNDDVEEERLDVL